MENFISFYRLPSLLSIKLPKSQSKTNTGRASMKAKNKEPSMHEAIIQALLAIDPAQATDTHKKRLTDVWNLMQDGSLRAASRNGGKWEVNKSVKEIILWAFRAGVLVDFEASGSFSFTDKDTLPVRHFHANDGIRIVPGGTTIRVGAHVAPGVIIMPPSYINTGAFVDEGTLVDSHALVGSCAQIGKNVHLSAGVQIGGVLEPAGAMPVVIEDDVLVGGNCGIYEGTRVCARAVIGTGVILTRSTPVYDLINATVYSASDDSPLCIPPDAVVVQGSRPARGAFAHDQQIHIYTPVIVKYRDAGTSAKSALEQALREIA
jgi:2,3,4,5-tetrahydropyridine-2-carboxylate N-succinyltransferase